MPRKITNKRKEKFRKTLRRRKKQRGGDDADSNIPPKVDMSSELSQVMASLPSSKIFPRRIDNKLEEAFKRSKINNAWRTLVTEKRRSESLDDIVNHIEKDYDREEANMPDPAMLYLLLITRAWLVSFVNDYGGYKSARQKFIKQTSDVGDAGDLYSVISGNVEQFLDVLSEPKTPDEYNEVMKYIFDNPHLVLSVSSYVFDISPSPEDDANRENENENESSVARQLQFGGGRKNRKSHRKGKKANKKKTLKRRIRKNHNKYLKK